MELNLESPRKDPAFNRYWYMYICDIKDRPNLKPSHLGQLTILCDLYVQYDHLREVVAITGYTVSNGGGRNGETLKISPEVMLLNKVISEIRNYSRILGLLLMEDTKTKKEEEENGFE